ncbi:hypothetical protein Q1695_007776 [Nippostrongylus brasiliensis]|nr:hypothetical protein Q1695_007776 [Nippostrongylus brasiliensis]
MVVWFLVERNPNTKVVCAVTAPMGNAPYQFVLHAIMVINIMIIVCYAIFLCIVTRVRINQEQMKQIYRSLIVISLSTVFGWFSTILIGLLGVILNFEIEQLYIDLLAGLFVNCSCACNFFVYYTVSKEYRRLFDYYLAIGRFKRVIGFKTSTATETRTTLPQRVHPVK